MSDDQKIWFIYLQDKHDGPFTPAEVADKVRQNIVNGQSLAWKDGMAEWATIESIPELKAALDSTGAAAPAAAAPESADGGPSLAQMLAASQQGGSAPDDGGISLAAAEPAASAESSAMSALAGLTKGAQSSVMTDSGAGADEPSPDAEVWTLRIGGQVSGLHSMTRLLSLAAEGEIAPDAALWRPGWLDFQSIDTVPKLAAARKARKGATSATKIGVAKPAGAKSGLAPLVAGASIGDDEPTDPGVIAGSEAKGFKKILEKIKSLFQRKNKKAQEAPQASASALKSVMAKTKPTSTTSASKVGIKKGSVALKKVLSILLVLLVLGGAGAGYWFFLASPLPSDLDVTPDDMEQMLVAVKQDAAQPALKLALARGTEENPADDTDPKFYVATNLPEGTQISMSLAGEPGTLVNKISFNKSFSVAVGKNKLAVFEQLKDDGKPLPMGFYQLKVTAEGAPEFSEKRFMGGKKGPVYEKRLKQYQEKLQGEYDKEMQELRQFIETLKSYQTDVSKKISEYKADASNPIKRGKHASDWKNFSLNFQTMASQFDLKVKERLNAVGDQKFHPRAYQDIATTLTQLMQLVRLHSARVEGGTPESNPDELEGLVQAGVLSMEQWLTSALTKNPLEALKESASTPAPGSAASAAATPVATSAVTPAATPEGGQEAGK